MRALAAAALCLIGAAEAALTEQQVNEALGSVPGVSWSVEGPNAEAWTVVGSGATRALKVSTLEGGVFAVKAVVTGPGALELKSRQTSTSTTFSGWTEVDGVGRSSGYDIWDARRINVGPGEHTVTWKVDRRFADSQPGTVEFSAAKWEPYTVLPLQVGAKDSSVTLSGTWLGQDRWHRGDGGAAYAPAGSGVDGATLRADFAGPGVLAYRVLPRKGSLSLMLGGSHQGQIYSASGWRQRWLRVGAGNHMVRWQANGSDTDAVVDEIGVVQEVDLNTALDLPGQVWTVDDPQRAIGLPMEDARGGSAVVLDSRLSTQFTGGGFLKIRHRGDDASFELVSTGGYVPYAATTEPGTDWVTKRVGIPAAGGTFQITAINSYAEFDGAEWEPMPGTLAEALGLPEQSTTTGGEATWEMVPVVTTGKFAVRATLSTAAPTAWAETVLTGPAKVEIEYDPVSDGTLEFLLDGERMWDSLVPVSTLYGEKKKVTLEVPAGEHVLRCASRLPSNSSYGQSVTIHEIRVMASERAAEISEALGFGSKWARVGEWEKVTALTHDGVAALRPVVEGVGPQAVWLGTTVTGPGYLSFWTHLPESNYPHASLTIHGDMLPYSYPESFAVAGWYEHRQWVPPGTHHVELRLYGSEEQMAEVVVDEMRFTPSVAAAALGDIGSGEPLVWVNDPVRPWTIWVKEPGAPAVAVSPEPSGEESSRISTKVTGPGLLKFNWRKMGRRLVGGTFLMDGVELRSVTSGYGVEVALEIPAGEHDLEWVQGAGSSGSWVEVVDVNWQAWPESSLASALDTPEGVTWTTGGDASFTGRPDEGSKGGTAAYVRLEPYQSAWLEATVEGPGVFDFWLRETVTSAGAFQFVVNWVMTVDGVEVLRSGQSSWNPVWIREAGTHQVRITFTNPAYRTVTGLMDEVSWIPLVAKTLDSSWTADVSEPWNGYAGADGGGLILRTSYLTPSWVEKTVTGPCEVMWNSRAIAADGMPAGVPRVTVDGKAGVVLEQNKGWQRHVLGIPAGTHTIRWENVTGDGDGNNFPTTEEEQESLWQISEPVVTPGVSAIAQAVDAPGSCWLVIGAQDATVTGAAAMDGVDAYGLGEDGVALYLNLSGTPQRLTCGVSYADDGIWQVQRKVVEADQAIQWGGTYGFAEPLAFALDAFAAENLTETTMPVAVDLAGGVTATGWRGVVSATESADGVDAGWSFLDDTYSEHEAAMEVEGAARVRFRWKRAGHSTLVLRLNGAVLPVTPAGAAWAEVSFEVGNGENRIEWEHASVEGTSHVSPGEAWLDAVSIEPLAPWDLTAVAAAGSGVELTADLPEDAAFQWKAASFQVPGGGTVTGARAATGNSLMRATITGPVVVHFRGACFAEKAAETMMAERSGGKSVIIIIGGGGGGGSGAITGYELTARVGEKVVASVPYRDGVAWSDASFLVPQGTHEVTWQVSALRSGILGTMREAAISWEMQAMVSGIRLESVRVHFDNWAGSLPEGKRGPDDDADGDGVSNLLEYAFRSSPGDASSMPPQVMGRMGLYIRPWVNPNAPTLKDGLYDTGIQTGSYEMMVPYLSPFVEGTLEVSGDLKSWDEHPVQWLESKPTGGIPIIGGWGHTDTHQVVSVPLYQGDESKYFRVKVKMPE